MVTHTSRLMRQNRVIHCIIICIKWYLLPVQSCYFWFHSFISFWPANNMLTLHTPQKPIHYNKRCIINISTGIVRQPFGHYCSNHALHHEHSYDHCTWSVICWRMAASATSAVFNESYESSVVYDVNAKCEVWSLIYWHMNDFFEEALLAKEITQLIWRLGCMWYGVLCTRGVISIAPLNALIKAVNAIGQYHSF